MNYLIDHVDTVYTEMSKINRMENDFYNIFSFSFNISFLFL